jgi:DNA-binding Lrp family transcriptional regulator
MCIATVSLKNYTQEEFKAFENRIDGIPEVVEFFTVSGESDFIIRIICADMNRYLEINDELVSTSSNQININSYVVMKENKSFERVALGTLKGGDSQDAG